MMKRFFIILFLGVGAPMLAFAEPAGSSDLQQFLAKRFKQGRGVFGAIASAIPGKLDPNSIAGMEGRKADGSFWTSVFFNGSNIRMFDDPRNALVKFCASSGNTLKRFRPYVLAPKQGIAFFSTKLSDHQGSSRRSHITMIPYSMASESCHEGRRKRPANVSA